jgi:hypothetical protein
MAMPALRDHALVWGTALALRYGHRLSVDLDLFGNADFDHDGCVAALTAEFGDEFRYEPTAGRRFGLFCFIEGIKVDIVRYPHALLEPIVVEDGVRMYADSDIAAMKVQAILGRAKKKDFWDLSELLEHHELRQVIEWHKRKFPSQMIAISISSALSYFSEAEESQEPVCLKARTWPEVKRSIQQAISGMLK